MACISSILFRKDLKRELMLNNGVDYFNHVVSLTSSTYGVLNLENTESKRSYKSPPREEPEIINAWELMEDLEEGIPISNQPRKSPKIRTPLKFLNHIVSPSKSKISSGKENKGRLNGPGRVGLNQQENTTKPALKLNYPVKSDGGFSSRRSLSSLFDPELVASYERELSQIKKFDKTTCLPGGENAVVIYTTTLRGIRKTFEDCNKVRLIVESHGIEVLERDVSMDSGFKEELRGLMGRKEVKVPVLFVKGRVIIEGAEQVLKLEEEGKLGVLFEGVKRRGVNGGGGGGCEGCGGVRFVICRDCNGSCKVLDELEKKMVKCCVCNENGLVQCPFCSCL